MFSIGFKFGEYGGHFNNVINLSLVRKFMATLDLCLGSLSYIKINPKGYNSFLIA